MYSADIPINKRWKHWRSSQELWKVKRPALWRRKTLWCDVMSWQERGEKTKNNRYKLRQKRLSQSLGSLTTLLRILCRETAATDSTYTLHSRAASERTAEVIQKCSISQKVFFNLQEKKIQSLTWMVLLWFVFQVWRKRQHKKAWKACVSSSFSQKLEQHSKHLSLSKRTTQVCHSRCILIRNTALLGREIIRLAWLYLF